VGLHCVKLGTKIVRFYFLFDRDIPFRGLAGVSPVYHMYQTFYPVQTGNLTLIALTRRFRQSAGATGGAIVLNQLILFFLNTGCLLVGIIILLVRGALETNPWTNLLLGALGTGLVLAAAFVFRPDFVVNASKRLLDKIHLSQRPIGGTCHRFLDDFLKKMSGDSAKRRLGPVAAAGAAQTGTQVLYFYCQAIAIGVVLSPEEVLVLAIALTLVTSLPLDIFLGLARYELTWMAFFALSAATTAGVLEVAVTAHAFDLLLVFTFGVLGALWLRRFQPRETSSQTEDPNSPRSDQNEG
jgi:hypothetical protein